MQHVRNRDIDNINVRTGNHGLPIVRDFLPSPLRRCGFELGLVAATDNLQAECVTDIKEMSDLAEGIGMRLGNKTGTDHCNVQLLLGHRCILESCQKRVSSVAVYHRPSKRNGHPERSRRTLEAALLPALGVLRLRGNCKRSFRPLRMKTCSRICTKSKMPHPSQTMRQMGHPRPSKLYVAAGSEL